ncbi:hypothetical protein B0H13DRAFT_2373050 [Mycena leptocephala]|nr:hypothetical protein B0H13DRAFT_2373050 [Mycena leptocephala]
MLEGAGAPARVLSAARTAAPMGCGVGLDPSTRANYVPQFLSLDFSRRTLALAGVKRRARSYSLHFSRASPPSPFPGLALLAPALHPFLPPLLSSQGHPYLEPRTGCVVPLFSSLPFLSLSLPFFLPTCKDGNELDQTPNKRPSFPFFGCIGVLMHRLGCAAAGTVRVRVNVGLGDLPSLSSCLGCVDVSRPNATSVEPASQQQREF